MPTGMYLSKGYWEHLYPISDNDFLEYIERNGIVISKVETTDSMDHFEGFNIYVKINKAWSVNSMDEVTDILTDVMTCLIVDFMDLNNSRTRFYMMCDEYGNKPGRCALCTVWFKESGVISAEHLFYLVNKELDKLQLSP